MPDAHITEEHLNHYFDGELAQESLDQVSTHLQGCDHCASRLDALGALHRGIQVTADASAREVDFDALFSKIERGIAEGDSKLVSLQARRPGRLLRVARAATLLAAAGAVIAFGLQGRRPTSASIEIEQVAFNDDYGGTVFEVAVADGVSTKVVWINDYYDDDESDAEEAIQ